MPADIGVTENYNSHAYLFCDGKLLWNTLSNPMKIKVSVSSLCGIGLSSQLLDYTVDEDEIVMTCSQQKKIMLMEQMV